MTVPSKGRPRIELMMAVWTPGSYLLREYARHIEDLQASGANGQRLEFGKKNKNRWLVETDGSDKVRVNYRLYCREMSVRTNWVDRDFAILNGAPTFLTPVGETERPRRVFVKLPPQWKRSITALKPLRDQGPHVYEARDFDHLVDSPILAGNPAVYEFELGGRKHILANQGEGGIWDGPRSAKDVAKIVQEHQRLWGSVPYDRYIFFNLITESGGGLEHDDGTVLMTSRWKQRVRKDYLDWLGLVSHEFYHTWNVRRLRPKALVEYDYENENYTRSLWIAEGITSYYDDLSLVRAGLCKQKEYFERFSKNIERLQTTPGRHRQSLHLASHDTWIKFYRPDENSINSAVSYYTKGAVAAFLLDAEIRRATDSRKSLDHVMRVLFDRHAGKRGYTPEEFRAIAGETAGRDLASWFRRAIDSTEELDYSGALDWFGLVFADPKKKKDGEETEEAAAKKKDPEVWLGLTTRTQDGRLLVARVLRDSPAYASGFNPDDEIVAVDDFRVLASKWSTRLKQYKPGDRIRILVSRREKLLELPVTFAAPPSKKWRLELSKTATEEQKKRLRAWLVVAERF